MCWGGARVAGAGQRSGAYDYSGSFDYAQQPLGPIAMTMTTVSDWEQALRTRIEMSSRGSWRSVLRRLEGNEFLICK